MIVNPCSWDWSGAHGAGAHTLYTFDPIKTTVGLLYPVWSMEVCGSYFDNYDRETGPGLLLHEFLHHTFNDFGLIRDGHPVGATEGVCGHDHKCYEVDEALALAQVAPEHAVVNNANYQFYTEIVGAIYTKEIIDPNTGNVISVGFCDSVNQGLCFPSDCCGNGEHEPTLGEVCDGTDVGTAACIDFGLTEGTVVCTADCQALDPSGCFGSCGNGDIDPALNELCDENDFGGQTCASIDPSKPVGFLECTADCFVDVNGCGTGTPPTNCTAGEIGCVCADVESGVSMDDEASHPDGDFSIAKYCPDNPSDGTKVVCVGEVFSGLTAGVCRACPPGEGNGLPGCECLSEDDCKAGLACFGEDTQGGGSLGHCYDITDGVPSLGMHS